MTIVGFCVVVVLHGGNILQSFHVQHFAASSCASIDRDETTCATTKMCAHVFAHSTKECFYSSPADVFSPNSRPRVNNALQVGQGISSKVYEAGFSTLSEDSQSTQ